MTLRTLYLESFAGVAGDMFTAAILDAGLVDPEMIRSVPELLKAPEVRVEIEDVQRANARFKQVRVLLSDRKEEADHKHLVEDARHQHAVEEADHQHLVEGAHRQHTVEKADHQPASPGHDEAHAGKHHHYHYPALVRQLEESALDPVAKEFALGVFRLLAEAEADSHGLPVEQVVFHEVGALDSLVDVAMAGVCVSTVAPDRVLASPVKLGRGTIQIQHGTFPVPPPASARLAVGMPVAPVPEAITPPDIELSTPTGLAILKALDPEFVEAWPSGTLVAQGSGAGTRDLGDYPNVFRVALMEQSDSFGPMAEGPPSEASPSRFSEFPTGSFPFQVDQIVELRCNVDDQTGERTAWAMEKALALGAVDAWVEQLVGKKGRPAVCMAFLAAPETAPVLADFLLRYTSTFGVRFCTWDRFKLDRGTEVRETPHGPLSFKVGRTVDGERVKEKPEFEELKEIWEEDPDFKP